MPEPETERNEFIVRLKEEGKSHNQIARLLVEEGYDWISPQRVGEIIFRATNPEEAKARQREKWHARKRGGE